MTRFFSCSLMLLSLVSAGLSSVAFAETPPLFVLKWGAAGAGNGQFSYPTGIATDAAGNVYVAEQSNNRIQKFTGAGVYITQWGSFGTGDGQFHRPYGVTTDTQGFVYVTDADNHRIQKFTSNGVYVTQWGSLGGGNLQLNTPALLATDAASNVYVADYGNQRIVKYTSAGSYVTQWGSLGTGNGQFTYPTGVAIDADNNVYVTDYNNNRIEKFTSGGTYLSQWGVFGAGAGQLYAPGGIATDFAGNVYVVDLGNERVQKFTGTGTYLSQWGSLGTGDGQFDTPIGVATDAAGDVYVADSHNQRVEMFASVLPPVFVLKWGDPGAGNGQFSYPTGVATDAAGNVYVAEQSNNRVQKFTGAGVYVTQWGSLGTGDGQFNRPYGIATDPQGFVYVTDADNHRIQKFTSSGVYVTQWGSLGSGNLQLHTPALLATDAASNVYVADYGNHRIVKYTSAGSYVTQWGSLGTGDGQFTYPTGVAIDADNNVYVTDYNNHRIEKFTDGGTYLAQWGAFGTGNGQFNSPGGIATDVAGNVYVAEIGNERVQKFTGTGTFLSLWGSLGTGDGQFDTPIGVATDAGGDVYVADSHNHRVEMFANAGSLASEVSFDGVDNTALGGAQLQVTGGGALLVSGIGSSGNDGVEFPTPDPATGRGISFSGGGISIDPSIDAGARLEVSLKGTAASLPVSHVTLRTDVTPTGLDIKADFSGIGSSQHTVEVYLGDVRVHACRVPNGTVIHRGLSAALVSSNPRTFGTLSVEAAGDGIGGVEVGLKKKPGGRLDPSITFTKPKMVTVNGVSVVGDRLKFSAIAPNQPLAFGSTQVKALSPGAASNFRQLAVASQPPFVSKPAVQAGGLVTTSLGHGILGAGVAVPLTVTGIGSSGNDGVEFDLTSVGQATHNFGPGMGFSTSTDAGASLLHRVRGMTLCDPDSLVGTVKETVFPDSIVLRSDFSFIGATSQRITVRSNGTPVYTATHGLGQGVQLVATGALQVAHKAPNTPMAASINTTRSNIKDKAGITAEGKREDIVWVYTRPGGGGPMPFDVQIGATRVNGDEIVFSALNGDPVSDLSSAEFLQLNPGIPRLDSLRFAAPGLSLGASGVANTSLGNSQLLSEKNKSLVLHNIGSSGSDGARVTPPAPVPVLAVKPSGAGAAGSLRPTAAISFSGAGRTPGGASIPGIHVQATPSAGAFKLTLKPPGSLMIHTESTTYRLQVFSGSTLLASLDGSAPEAVAAVLPDIVQEDAVGPAFDSHWNTPLSIAIVGGSTVVGNRLRIEPVGEPDSVASFDSMDILATDLDHIVLDGLDSGGAADVPSIAPVGDGIRLTLGQNPARGRGPLAFGIHIPVAQHVRLALFDAAGRRVVTIHDGPLPAGESVLRWVPGSGLGSSVYLAQLKADGGVQVQKLIYLR